MNKAAEDTTVTTEDKIIVLYDGDCRLCQGSVRTLMKLDWRNKLHYIDFQHEPSRLKVAPQLKYEDLDKAMHIKLPDGRFLNGFDAFRAMSWSLPALCWAAPLLYIPGIPLIGRKVYAVIAERRKDCNSEACAL